MQSARKQRILDEGKRALLSLFGTFLVALGINLFVVPSGLYTGGLMGLCQVVRTLLVDYLHLFSGSFDFAGILYYIINLPLLIVAWKVVDRKFVLRSLVSVTTMTLFLSILPTTALMGSDTLTACLVGGMITGLGGGLILRAGSTGGGTDVVGVMIARKRRNVGIGQIGLIVNVALYTCCLLLFNVQVAIYSLVYAMVASFATDRIHIQNINEEVIVITKGPAEGMTQAIMENLARGVTRLDAHGGYTGEPCSVLYVVISKFEFHRLRNLIREYDPNAFVTVKEHTDVYGNYLQKL